MKKYIFIILFLFCSASLWAQEMTMYVGPQLIKCNSNLDVMCMQVKQTDDAGFQPFAYQIEGFTFESGYDYELLVDKGILNDPPTDRPGVKYTLKKIVSKKLPRVTLHIANRDVDCMLDQITPCILYKEDAGSQWDTLSTRIKGFKYKRGYDYELLVSKKFITSSVEGDIYEYTLIKTVSKKPTMIISAKNREQLDNKKFILAGYKDGNGEFQQAGSAPKPIMLNFNLDENSAGGSDGCNQIGSQIEINNSVMKFVAIMSTQMFCEGVKIDSIVRANLAKIDKYKISEGTLKLYQGKTLLLEYTRLMEDLMPPPKK